jgi:hypothetical protein
MSFTPYKGTWTSMYIPKKASTTYTAGTILYNDGTDNVTATTTSATNWCICQESYASSDTTTSYIKVMVPRSLNTCTMLGDIGSGTPAVANIGKMCDIASGGATTAHATDTHHQLRIVGYKSATVGEYAFNYTTPAS